MLTFGQRYDKGDVVSRNQNACAVWTQPVDPRAASCMPPNDQRKYRFNTFVYASAIRLKMAISGRHVHNHADNTDIST